MWYDINITIDSVLSAPGGLSPYFCDRTWVYEYKMHSEYL